ncbi:hypothetical protein BJ684DRAFT_19057 [Piptocephalis cylindrospora]|uniref:Uncharacterized protein n=1 Tax=Piptocephalis cylindrospora TaxID=1907219 RepID=A0A4P9Y8A1_9FUNG|nr:hypothetical protein BJ684DRAFT_19057 [Piptocephalis cylindrospora]|eukprot:RKP14551.1 hypothetical protein BJ684DRAFT_19057 [Piptocephalis cylindrospora]
MILPTPAASDINVDQGEGTAVPDSNRPFPPLPSMETIHRIVLAARSIEFLPLMGSLLFIQI